MALMRLVTTGLARYQTVRRQINVHRRWTLRSSALIFAVPLLRVYLLLGVAAFGLGFELAYVLAGLLC
jgi:hypothetical protein